jgi:endonuclease/exonuclease/phosphatase family metal-dependent hydrolase
MGARVADLLIATADRGSQDRLRVVTLNLLYYPQGDRWRERRPLVEHELHALHPDVLGLQEVNRSIDQDHALAAREGSEPQYVVHRASATVRDRYPRHWDGVVLLVARTTGRVMFHQARRLTYLRVVQALGITRSSGASVTIVNTHLHHPEGPAGERMRLRQVSDVLRFIEALPPTGATVLLGDLNATPDEPALGFLFAEGFRSASREVGLGDLPTFPSGLVAPTIYRGPGVSIDYVLVRGMVRVIDVRLGFDQPSAEDPGLFPSDHRGLLADLALD